jgi:radical SAM protein with 4Fe4S-binding SPASM domain
MIARARAGSRTVERFAGIFLTKILRGDDPGYLDIRSPCGAGIGQLAYDATGAIYTCDEGRMLAREGDETFRLGHVRDARYRALMAHPTVRAMLVASNLDAQPACTACAYRPYCGVCPVHNHKTQRSLAGRTRESSLCAAYIGIQDFLFETLARADGPTRAVLERWTSSPPRERFVHRAPR